jgi:hypothetical protein
MDDPIVTGLLMGAVVVPVLYFGIRLLGKRELAGRLATLEDFTVTWQLVGTDGKSALAVDQGRNVLALLAGPSNTRRVNCSDILSVAILEDGASVTETNRGSQLGGAIVGGALFGGVGALAGALSGSTRTSGKVRRVELRLTLNDANAPTFSLCLSDSEMEHGGITHRVVRDKAREWQGRVEVLMRQATATEPPQAERTGGGFLTAELEKLARMKQEGSLSEEEFSAAKRQILSGQ